MDELTPLLSNRGDLDYKLFEFETCENENSKLVGIRFILRSESNPEKLELTPMGRMEGYCETMLVNEYEI